MTDHAIRFAVLLAVMLQLIGCNNPNSNPLTRGWLPEGTEHADKVYLHDYDGFGSFDFSEATPGSSTVGISAGVLMNDIGADYLPLGELNDDNSITFGESIVTGGWERPDGSFVSFQDNYDTFVRGTWQQVSNWRFDEDWYDEELYPRYGENCPSYVELWEQARDELNIVGFYNPESEDTLFGEDNPHMGIPSAQPLERVIDTSAGTDPTSMPSTYRLARAPVYEFFCEVTNDCADLYEGVSTPCSIADQFTNYGSWE